MSDVFCNNCGKYGHLFYICKIPITSIGIIVFRVVNGVYQYLMIRRKDTLGYVDFTRGKFLVGQKQCIMNMLIQMTAYEKESLLRKYEHVKSGNGGVKDKIADLIRGVTTPEGEFYDLKTLIMESKSIYDWEDPEWGFPKGRRNANECDYDCAVREFAEETGYPAQILNNIRNVVPFEETFTGSNYNSYRHKYYLMFVSYADSIVNHKYQKAEVSGIDWFPVETCSQMIRPYNLEKKRLIQSVDQCLKSNLMFSVNKK
jgi:8-oxo-dGTP pyrophosphatase MutT (NUDIX family)